jgi:hypothetical protein
MDPPFGRAFSFQGVAAHPVHPVVSDSLPASLRQQPCAYVRYCGLRPFLKNAEDLPSNNDYGINAFNMPSAVSGRCISGIPTCHTLKYSFIRSNLLSGEIYQQKATSTGSDNSFAYYLICPVQAPEYIGHTTECDLNTHEFEEFRLSITLRNRPMRNMSQNSLNS